jgi:hypothetical protein
MRRGLPAGLVLAALVAGFGSGHAESARNDTTVFDASDA